MNRGHYCPKQKTLTADDVEGRSIAATEEEKVWITNVTNRARRETNYTNTRS
jgi:hypothetical protein